MIVESYEEPDEFDGYPEKNLPKKHPEFMRAREVCSSIILNLRLFHSNILFQQQWLNEESHG